FREIVAIAMQGGPVSHRGVFAPCSLVKIDPPTKISRNCLLTMVLTIGISLTMIVARLVAISSDFERVCSRANFISPNWIQVKPSYLDFEGIDAISRARVEILREIVSDHK